ncbi:transcriptional regulator BetI [Falsiruegeria litorea R37]|uniref:Transcriptional regulator BetI n=1 Tax=Falsiruegeria litorea R37 TaxID=1200284 RepID=A0A1Y5RUE5_9RHOB|nr:TetR/AcrR family transcriptional regulator [Falsiruegeria litorea]SLN25621.1 transcriptional regulator BetI [Falsiruegeria litorea R37]
MGRPSVQKQRKAEVLDAFLTCASKYGIEGATLERIATEAGLKRPLIRHHLGNRDDMVKALSEYVISAINELVQGMREALEGYPTAKDFIDALYTPQSETDPRLNIVFQSLTHSSDSYPGLREELISVMQSFFDMASEVMQRNYPHAPKAECDIVAQGVIGLYLTTDSLAPLAPPSEWAYSSYFASLRLANSLREIS